MKTVHIYHPKLYAMLNRFVESLSPGERTQLGFAPGMSARACLLQLETTQGLSVTQPLPILALMARVKQDCTWRTSLDDCLPLPRSRLAQLVPPAEGRWAEARLAQQLRRDWATACTYPALKRLLAVSPSLRGAEPATLLLKQPELAPLVRLALQRTLPTRARRDFYVLEPGTEAQLLEAAVDSVLAKRTVRCILGGLTAQHDLAQLRLPDTHQWLQALARAEAGGPLRKLFLEETAVLLDRCGWPYFFVSGRQAVRRLLHHQPPPPPTAASLPSFPRQVALHLQATSVPIHTLLDRMRVLYGSHRAAQRRIRDPKFVMPPELAALFELHRVAPLRRLEVLETIATARI